MMLTITCASCGKIFQSRSRGKRPAPRFCSDQCRSDVVPVWNKNLKGIHLSPLSEWKSGEHLGVEHSRWKEPLRFVCESCGTIYFRKGWRVKAPRVHHFCSVRCRVDWWKINMKGTLHPRYEGGKISYYGVRWKSQRDKARVRDGFLCQICKRKRRKNIHVHHIVSYKLFKTAEEGNQLANLICLCAQCHQAVHKRHVPCPIPLPLPVD